jgi:CheY-like chemotaxis protein/DNA-binding XRE family transcriptional regulator
MEKSAVNKAFGLSVKIWRNHMGLSQEALAEKSELHRTYISDVERGARNLSLKSIAKLAAALQISISNLFHSPLPEGANAGSGNRPNSKNKFVEVLLVEDNTDDVELTLRAFQQARLTNKIHVVRDGIEALDYLFCQIATAPNYQANRQQIVLLDLNLPKVSGLEVLRQIKADNSTQQFTVVVLSTSARSQDIDECLRLGASGYIVKPLDFQSLSRATPQLKLDWALLLPPETMAGRLSVQAGCS